MNSNYDIVLQGWMVQKLGLKKNELLVYALIYGFTQDGETLYHGGDKYLAHTLGLSSSTVRRILKRLMEKGLIAKSQEIVDGELLEGYSVSK